jgi:hypothetical protein
MSHICFSDNEGNFYCARSVEVAASNTSDPLAVVEDIAIDWANNLHKRDLLRSKVVSVGVSLFSDSENCHRDCRHKVPLLVLNVLVHPEVPLCSDGTTDHMFDEEGRCSKCGLTRKRFTLLDIDDGIEYEPVHTIGAIVPQEG